MLRYFLAAFVGAVLFGTSTTAQAQWLSNFFHEFPRDFKRNNDWPEPFVRPDREAVALPFGMMVANGWQRQNLLSDHHFDENNKLTYGGEMKVRWILTQVPVQRRIIFVQRAWDTEHTTARLDAVQQSAVRIRPTGELPEVVESNLVDEGFSAGEIEAVEREFGKSRPVPRLPAPRGDGAGIGS